MNDGWREHFEYCAEFTRNWRSAQQLPELKTELKENIAKLNPIDRSKFDELAKEQARLETELEKAGLVNSVHSTVAKAR